MGLEVFEELVDYEIRSLIKSLNKLSCLQTISSCSGWTDLYEEPTGFGMDEGYNNVSDGTNRKWLGNPYLHLLSLNEEEMIKFIKFILKNTVPDNFKNIEYGEGYLLHIKLDYKLGKLLYIINISEYNRTYEQIQKIWDFLNNLSKEYMNDESKI